MTNSLFSDTLSFMKNIRNFTIFAIILTTILFITGCSKDPLAGTWSDINSSLTFYPKDGTVLLQIHDQSATGPYEIKKAQRLVVQINYHMDSNEDYSERSANLGELGLCYISKKDGKLEFEDFFNAYILLDKIDGTSPEFLTGTWFYAEEAAALEIVFNEAESTFEIRQYSSDGFLTDDRGVISEIIGTFRLEETTIMTLNLTEENGFDFYKSGEFYFSNDKKAIYFDGEILKKNK